MPRHFFWRNMKELSVFIDESGDFGEYSFHAPFYIVTMVFHDQKTDIENELRSFETELKYLGLVNHCIHTGPIIRMEEDYKNMYASDRRRILNKMVAFIRKLDIKYHCFFIEKKQVGDVVEATGRLSKEISAYIRDNYQFFLAYDIVKIYYDNGQVELSKALSLVLNALLPNVEFRRVIPSEYRLFQVADAICTFELLSLKKDRKLLTKAEVKFFGSEAALNKDYLKHITKKEI